MTILRTADQDLSVRLTPVTCPRCGAREFYTTGAIPQIPAGAATEWMAADDDTVYAMSHGPGWTQTVHFRSIDLYCQMCHARATPDQVTQVDSQQISLPDPR